MTADTTAARVCECGCGEPLDKVRPGARYATDACRSRAWKARTGYGDPRRAKARRNARPARKRAPELRISYRRAVEHLASELERLDLVTPPTGRGVAETLLYPVLTDRQREALRA